MCLVSYSKLEKYNSLNKVTKKGKWGWIELTELCNRRCAWCYGSFDSCVKPKVMTLELLKTTLEVLKDVGVTQITLTGGEPMLYPQIKEAIQLVDDYEFDVHIVSNGTNITPEFIEFAEQNGVNQIAINYQGKKWHDKIQGVKGSYEVAKDAIELLLKSKIEVVAHVTFGQYNIEEIPSIFDELAEFGLQRLRVWDVAGNAEYRGKISTPELFAIPKKKALELGYKHILSYDPEIGEGVHPSCPSTKLISLTPDGEVATCPVLRDQGGVVGNIQDSSIKDVLLNLRRCDVTTCPARIQPK